MSVKINVKSELGINKPIEVKQSNKVVRKTWLLQKQLAKMAIDDQTKVPDTAESAEAQLDTVLELQASIMNYVIEVLHLTDKQAEAVDELSFEDTVELANKISALVMGTETVPASEHKEETGLEA